MIRDIWGQAWEAMVYNRRRTFITVMGMAWGIATVVLLLAYGAGFGHAIQNIFGYGRFSAFNSVRAGDNWFYNGAPRYNPGAGIGTLDVNNLDAFLRSGF